MKTTEFVRRHTERLERNGRFSLQKGFVQHGVCSVYDHSVQVAVLSVNLTRHLGLHVNYNLLVRAALLHDYFLYDWHLPHGKFHGFLHPKVALKNARKDFSLSQCEENTILRHMFPLTPIPPKFLEGWIVCICDKICAVREIFRRDSSAVRFCSEIIRRTPSSSSHRDNFKKTTSSSGRPLHSVHF